MKRFSKILVTVTAVIICAVVTLGVLLWAHPWSASAETLLVKPLDEVVPAGSLLREDVYSSDGVLAGTYLVNPDSRTLVNIIWNETGGVSLPYTAIIVYDESGRSELNVVDLEVYGKDGADACASMKKKVNRLGGTTAEITGEDTIEGERLVTIAAELESADGPNMEARGWVDPASGLVVREERQAADEKVVITRRLVPVADEELGTVAREDLEQLADDMANERVVLAAQADFEVLALPAGAYDLVLANLRVQGDPDFVTAQYRKTADAKQNAIKLRMWDAEKNPQNPADMFPPLAQAEETDYGDMWILRYSVDGSLIQVEVTKAMLPTVTASDVAELLVPIAESGLIE